MTSRNGVPDALRECRPLYHGAKASPEWPAHVSWPSLFGHGVTCAHLWCGIGQTPSELLSGFCFPVFLPIGHCYDHVVQRMVSVSSSAVRPGKCFRQRCSGLSPELKSGTEFTTDISGFLPCETHLDVKALSLTTNYQDMKTSITRNTHFYQSKLKHSFVKWVNISS